jgi:predicted AAA+ superfamily ATPase
MLPTLFVGPQATGKSILLQLIKLLLDSQIIFYTYEKIFLGRGY